MNIGNAYTFVANNPLSKLDPTGLAGVDVYEVKFNKWITAFFLPWNVSAGSAKIVISVLDNGCNATPLLIKGLNQVNYPLQVGFDIKTAQTTKCGSSKCQPAVGFLVDVTFKLLLPGTTTKKGAKINLGIKQQQTGNVGVKFSELGASVGRTSGFSMNIDYWWEQTVIVSGITYDLSALLKCCPCVKGKSHKCTEVSFTGFSGVRSVPNTSGGTDEVEVKSHGFVK